MAGAGGFLADLNDPWLKPRLLRAVVAERLPQPGGERFLPAEVASVLDAVRTHGLLAGRLPTGAPDSKLAEAWRVAMNAWVECVGALLESDSTMPAMDYADEDEATSLCLLVVVSGGATDGGNSTHCTRSVYPSVEMKQVQ